MIRIAVAIGFLALAYVSAALGNGSLMMMGVGPGQSGTGGSGGTCSGTIDLSTGCVQPMLRGL